MRLSNFLGGRRDWNEGERAIGDHDIFTVMLLTVSAPRVIICRFQMAFHEYRQSRR